jgi:hypothetical protein
MYPETIPATASVNAIIEPSLPIAKFAVCVLIAKWA